MKRKISIAIVSTITVACMVLTANAQGRLMAGTGKSDITPPIGTPMAGYGARLGRPSASTHDPTEARALILDNGAERVAFLSVDHLGFDHGMVERVRALAGEAARIAPDHIFVMSSHTHSGGGAYLEIFPALAGKFDPKIRDFSSERSAEAVIAGGK